MSKNPLDSVLQHIRRIAGPGEAGDAGLLERFALQGDEAAFERIVSLHGPMVFGLCRRLLQHEQDAEDAFQATFLALARKAGTIGNKKSLSSWLYKVAFRVACRIRVKVPELTNRVAGVLDRPDCEREADAVWRDLRFVLDQEVACLSECYRVPIVLCHFEGKTNEEAARLLGCPKGTVATRLARAREQLRRRLTRRGLTLTSGLLTAVMSERALAVSVPVGLARSTFQSALAFTSGKTATAAIISAKVLNVSEGVLRMLWLNKMKMVKVAKVKWASW
jgi:RNA polymerase sigma factor (sigma-70 family)